tara:strand:+ start:3413 stop:4093 length:681 start_codon:yes stop_codon:yes gene_type:complete
VLSNIAGTYLSDPQFDELLAELNRTGETLFIHPTSPAQSVATIPRLPRPMMEFMFDEARAVVSLILGGVLARYPRIEVIVTHSGGALPLLADRIDLLKMASQELAATDSVRKALAHLWYDCAGTPFPSSLSTLLPLVGEERLLYGSDYCFTPPIGVGLQIGSLDGADTSLAQNWRQRTTSNAARLLSHSVDSRVIFGSAMLRRRVRTTLLRWLAGAIILRGGRRRS